MCNNWMTHVTSAEAERSSEELQLDSGLVSERLGGGGGGKKKKKKDYLGDYGSMLAPPTVPKVIFV